MISLTRGADFLINPSARTAVRNIDAISPFFNVKLEWRLVWFFLIVWYGIFAHFFDSLKMNIKSGMLKIKPSKKLFFSVMWSYLINMAQTFLEAISVNGLTI